MTSSPPSAPLIAQPAQEPVAWELVSYAEPAEGQMHPPALTYFPGEYPQAVFRPLVYAERLCAPSEPGEALQVLRAMDCERGMSCDCGVSDETWDRARALAAQGEPK